MAQRVNPTWMNQCIADIHAFKGPTGPAVFERTSNFNAATQWLIMALMDVDIPFKVLNMGAGVKKVTTDVTVCPKCKGTGHI